LSNGKQEAGCADNEISCFSRAQICFRWESGLDELLREPLEKAYLAFALHVLRVNRFTRVATDRRPLLNVLE
jgi:hypothetical protein